MSIEVRPINNYLFWTRTEYDQTDVLVVTADAPPEQVRFAEEWDEWCVALGIHRVIFEREVINAGP